MGLPDQCIGYNGIVHPKNPTKCCASTCGDLCGALNCEEGNGGVEACCGSGIQESTVCGANGQTAPCSIGTCPYIVQAQYIIKRFISIIPLSNNY